MTKLMILKSNPKTIVKVDFDEKLAGDDSRFFCRIVWADSMKWGYDSTWMCSYQSIQNLKPLSQAEKKLCSTSSE